VFSWRAMSQTLNYHTQADLAIAVCLRITPVARGRWCGPFGVPGKWDRGATAAGVTVWPGA
jgi:hypothetical protein